MRAWSCVFCVSLHALRSQMGVSSHKRRPNGSECRRDALPFVFVAVIAPVSILLIRCFFTTIEHCISDIWDPRINDQRQWQKLPGHQRPARQRCAECMFGDFRGRGWDAMWLAMGAYHLDKSQYSSLYVWDPARKKYRNLIAARTRGDETKY